MSMMQIRDAYNLCGYFGALYFPMLEVLFDLSEALHENAW